MSIRFLRFTTVLLPSMLTMALLLSSTLLLAQPAKPAIGIGRLIPSKSFGAVVINNPAKLNAKIGSLMQVLQLPVPELLPLAKFQLGFNNGFADNRPALMLLYPGKLQPVVPVFLIPTTKFADFQVNFEEREAHPKLKNYEIVNTNGEEMLLAARGDYAVLIPKEFEADLDDFLLDNETLVAELAKSETWIAERDASFVATKKGIRAGMKTIRQEFNNVKAMAGNQAGKEADIVKAVFDGYDFVFKSLAEQGELAVIGVKLDAQNNVVVEQHYSFTPNGSISTFLAKAGPAKSSDLAKMPAIPFVIASDLQVAPAFTEALLQPFKELLRIGTLNQAKQLTEEQLKQYQTIVIKMLGDVSSGAFVLGQTESGESLLDNVLYTVQVDNSSKYLKMYREQLAELQKIYSDSGLDISFKETKLSGKDSLEITQKGFLEQLKNQNPAKAREMQAIYSFIFGNRDSLRQWIAQADKTTLVGGMNEALLLDTLRDLAAKKSDFSKDADNALALGLLPSQRHATMLIDFGGYINLVLNMVKTMMPEGVGGNFPPQFPPAPAIGFSLTMSGEGVEITTVIPCRLISTGSLYFQALIGNNGLGL